MSQNVGVSRDKLESTASEITTCNSTMVKHLSAVIDAVDNMQTNYQSDASKQLKSIAGNMQTKFDQLKAEVETFASWLSTAAANYQVMEGQESETLGKIGQLFK